MQQAVKKDGRSKAEWIMPRPPMKVERQALVQKYLYDKMKNDSTLSSATDHTAPFLDRRRDSKD